MHEAAVLQRDLERAGIRPYAWVINQSLSPLSLRDPVLKRGGDTSGPSSTRCAGRARQRTVLVPWEADGPDHRACA